jgi:hypothetical protein
VSWTRFTGPGAPAQPGVHPAQYLVEDVLRTATAAGDSSVMERLLDVLATPYGYDRDVPGFTT